MSSETEENRSLPSLDALITLLGARELIEGLRAAKLERRIFLGFRSDPKSLANPVVRKRIEEALRSTAALGALSSRFEHAQGAIYTALEALPDPPAEDQLRVLAAQHGPELTQWALLLHPRASLNTIILSNLSNVSSSSNDREPDAEQAGVRMDAPVPPCAEPSMQPEPADSLQSPLAALEAKLTEQQRKIAALEAKLAAQQREMADLQNREQIARNEVASECKKREAIQRELEEAHRQARRVEDELRSAHRQVARLQKSLDEECRRADRAEKAVRRDTAKPGPISNAGPPRHAPAIEPAQASGGEDYSRQVVQKLLEKRLFGAAAAYSQEWLELDPNNPIPRRLLLEALTLDGQGEEVGRFHYQSANRALSENRREEAVAALCESIRASPAGPGAPWRMEKLIQIADAGSRADVAQIARLYGDLRRNALDAADTFESLVRRVKRGLWRRMPHALLQEHKRVEVEWPDAPRGSLSASELAAAIASADESLVERFRKWAARQTGEERQAAMQVIEGANAHLPGARSVLTATSRPVVVDGSNVAWSGCTPESGPDLENIRHVRQKLLEAGYFPIIILCDAALPFQVKDPDRIRRWELRGEIRLVQSQTDADESLLTEARRRECPIVTNDRLRDLDPRGRYQRIAYTLGPGGVTLEEKT